MLKGLVWGHGYGELLRIWADVSNPFEQSPVGIALAHGRLQQGLDRRLRQLEEMNASL